MHRPTSLRALWSLAFALAIGCATTPAAPTPATPPGPPPLVDRELYFDNPEIAGAQLSPDGAWITFLKPYQDVLNIWVKARSAPFASAKPLTADKRPVGGYFWSRDGKYVLYAQDKGGDENFHVYAVDPRAAAAANGVPEARDLTAGEKVRAEVLAVPKKTPDSVLVGINDRDPQLHDVYRVSLSTGKRELVRLNKEGVAGWSADNDGQLRLATKLDDAGGTQVYRVAGDALEPLYHCTAEESCGPDRFHKDGKRVYFESNTGTEDLTRLVLLDVATGKEELVETDPDKQVDFGGADFSEATDELSATYYEGDRLRTYPKTPAFKKDFEAVKKVLTTGDVSFVSTTQDESYQIVTVNSDVDPGATYLYERATGKVDFLYRPRPRLPLDTLVPMKPVRITARDGVVFTAYLTIPRGLTGPLPAVLLPHGGPWARDSWGYNSQAQFLANRGYVVLQPNFRGSTGYGKKFLNLGNGQWGTGTMQHDLSDARNWLVKEGYAADGKVAIMGGSYGGYATLAGVAFTPDLYAAGVDIVGPSNIVTLLNSIPPYWAPIKKMFAVRVGDIEKPADAERLQAQSPLNSAKKIKAPLLVIQGANDPRVKKAEADQIVIALRENKLPVEYLVAPDEGHGFHGRENRMAQMVAVERFLSKHLGGRVQESVAPDIATKLATLTVDISAVKLAAPPPPKYPAPVFSVAGFKPGKFKFKVSGTLQGKPIDGSSDVSVVKEKAGGFTVSSVDKMPFGEASETITLDAKTLMPTARTLKQGPATIELTYSAAGVKGTIKAGPQQMPVDAKSDGALVADGTMLGVVAGALPLAAGYKATANAFDLESGQVQSQTLEVTGQEKITVPAGSLEAWKLDVTAGGSTTSMWVEKAGAHRLLKLTTELPQGAGTLTQELLK